MSFFADRRSLSGEAPDRKRRRLQARGGSQVVAQVSMECVKKTAPRSIGIPITPGGKKPASSTDRLVSVPKLIYEEKLYCYAALQESSNVTPVIASKVDIQLSHVAG